MASLATIIRTKIGAIDAELSRMQDERAAFAAYKRAEQKRLQKEGEALAAWKRDEQRSMQEARAGLAAWKRRERARLQDERAEFEAWKKQALDRLEPTRRYKAEIAALKDAAAKKLKDGEGARKRGLTRRRRLEERVATPVELLRKHFFFSDRTRCIARLRLGLRPGSSFLRRALRFLGRLEAENARLRDVAEAAEQSRVNAWNALAEATADDNLF